MTVATPGRLTKTVVLVVGGDRGVGKALALRLTAVGAWVLVAGPDERALGEVVGEAVFGGGKARHMAAASGDWEGLEGALRRTRETLGPVEVVALVGEAGQAFCGDRARLQRLAAPATIVVVDGVARGDEDAAADRVLERLQRLGGEGGEGRLLN